MKKLLFLGLLLSLPAYGLDFIPSPADLALYNKVKKMQHNKAYVEGFCDAVRSAERSQFALEKGFADELLFSAGDKDIIFNCKGAL